MHATFSFLQWLKISPSLFDLGTSTFAVVMWGRFCPLWCPDEWSGVHFCHNNMLSGLFSVPETQSFILSFVNPIDELYTPKLFLRILQHWYSVAAASGALVHPVCLQAFVCVHLRQVSLCPVSSLLKYPLFLSPCTLLHVTHLDFPPGLWATVFLPGLSSLKYFSSTQPVPWQLCS